MESTIVDSMCVLRCCNANIKILEWERPPLLQEFASGAFVLIHGLRRKRYDVPYLL
jgi:hypothetical protein